MTSATSAGVKRVGIVEGCGSALELFAARGPGAALVGLLFGCGADLLVNPISPLCTWVAAQTPSQGESLDLVCRGEVGAVAAAGVAGVGAAAGVAGVAHQGAADADPRVGAVATAGVAALGADADPGVGAVAAAGVAAGGTDADPAAGVAGVANQGAAAADPGAVAAAGVAGAGADADPRVGAVAAAGVAGDAPSARIICAFQRISSSVRGRLAAGSRLPYSLCLPFLMPGMSLTIVCRVSKKTCLSWIQSKRSLLSAAAAVLPESVAAAPSRKHRSR